MVKAGSADRIYEAAKLVAVVDTLADQGIAPADVLAGLGVEPDDLQSTATRVSTDQLLGAFRNAMRLSSDPALPFRIGSSIHVSAYGMYGYAILCGTDFRRTMDFAVKYHMLAAPLADIVFAEDKRQASWTLSPLPLPQAGDRLRRFIVELQIAIHISLQRDVMGSGFAPREIWLSYPRAADFSIPDALAGCPVLFEQSVNRILFDRAWLDARPALGNRHTYAEVTAMCDALLADMRLRSGVAGKVRTMLLQDVANGASFEAVAARLGLNTRTLRRQLRAQNTSFRELADEVRAQLAVRYLRETAMTNDDIAYALGFSDAANFRHAFRRWTGQPPGAFRTARSPSITQR